MFSALNPPSGVAQYAPVPNPHAVRVYKQPPARRQPFFGTVVVANIAVIIRQANKKVCIPSRYV